MSFVHDEDRPARLGMPEAIYCEGKDAAALDTILAELASKPGHPTLLTCLTAERHGQLDRAHRDLLDFDSRSATAIMHRSLPARAGSVAVVTAGTSDLRVACEAQRTLEFAGFSTALIADVGVAGVHRLLGRIDEVRRHDVVIVVAGWDAALASVVGGLVPQPVIAVPTSIGYGVAQGGRVALNSMLASCGQGIVVTNIDNGFGAACGAIRFLNRLDRAG